MPVPQMSPADLKLVIDRRLQIESAWTDRELLVAILNTPVVRRKVRRPNYKKTRKPVRTRLTRGQYRELKRLRMPKGVDWSRVELNRTQQHLLEQIHLRRQRKTNRTQLQLAS